MARISCPCVGSISMMYISGDLFLGMRLGNSVCMRFVWEPLRTDFGKEPSLLQGMRDWETSRGSGETLKCCSGIKRGS